MQLQISSLPCLFYDVTLFFVCVCVCIYLCSNSLTKKKSGFLSLSLGTCYLSLSCHFFLNTLKCFLQTMTSIYFIFLLESQTSTLMFSAMLFPQPGMNLSCTIKNFMFNGFSHSTMPPNI